MSWTDPCEALAAEAGYDPISGEASWSQVERYIELLEATVRADAMLRANAPIKAVLDAYLHAERVAHD